MANFSWPAVSVSSGPVQFNLNSVATVVSKDTVTPASSRPLPVELLSGGAAIDLTLLAKEAKQDSQITEAQTANATLLDLDAQLTDVNAELNSQTTQLTAIAGDVNTLAAIDYATETTLGAIDDKLPATIGQKAASASLAVVLASDQELPLPSGAATEATLATRASEATVATLATEATAAAMSAKLPATLGQKAMAASLAVTLASDQSSVPVTVGGPTIPAATGSFAQVTNLVATAQTLTAPANAVGFKIQAPSTNTENISFSIGATATITAGILMEPGRSEDFDTGSNISVIATSAEAQTVNVIWRIRP